MPSNESQPDLESEIARLRSFTSLEVVPDASLSKANLKIASKSLSFIARNADRESLEKFINLTELVTCGLNLIEASFLRRGIDPLSARHPGKKIRKDFCTLLALLLPDRASEIIDVVLGCMREGVLQTRHESLTTECLDCLCLCGASCDLILEKMLDFIEEMIIGSRIDEATNACRALYLSREENFKRLSADALARLLSLFHLSVERSDSNHVLCFFKIGFEITVKKIFRVMDIDELLRFAPKALVLTFDNEMRSKEALKDFGLTVQEIFARLASAPLERTLKPEILEFLLSAMTLECEVKSFLACRYLTLICDRLGNAKRLATPKIFHAGSSQSVRVSREKHEALVEANYNALEAAILTAIKHHGFRMSNLCALYALVGVLLTAMPAAATHIMAIDILMDLQACMIDGRAAGFGSFNRNQIHALVISLMTLICWTTRAKSLSKYVGRVVSARHNLAPHLLPPLRESYAYEPHHVLTGKAELFLDKWEMRYYLYRLHHLETLTPSEFMPRRSETKNSFFKFNLFSRKTKRDMK